MRIGDICTNDTICCTREATVQDAAMLMRRHHVGDLVVVESEGGGNVPLGILTDRDIVLAVVAPGLDPASLLAGDVMSDDLLTASASDDVHEAIEHMRLRGIRRVPVVDADGKLAGIVSADDLLEFLAAEMSELSRIGSWQQSHERRVRQ